MGDETKKNHPLVMAKHALEYALTDLEDMERSHSESVRAGRMRIDIQHIKEAITLINEHFSRPLDSSDVEIGENLRRARS